MKRLVDVQPGAVLAAGVAAGLLLCGAFELLFEPLVLQAHAQQTPQPEVPEVRDLQAAPNVLDGSLPDQAHAMADVGYHFANLWYAADQQNWQLANYYLGETRSHLKWAVRIHAVRKTSTGAEVDLNGIMEAVDNTFLSEIGAAITNRDAAGFETAYRHTLEGCYACHKACEKPFLRPQIPSTPAATILDFDPDATWPK